MLRSIYRKQQCVYATGIVGLQAAGAKERLDCCIEIYNNVAIVCIVGCFFSFLKFNSINLAKIIGMLVKLCRIKIF